MAMDAPTLTAFGGLLVAAGGLFGAWATVRYNREKAATEKQTADVAQQTADVGEIKTYAEIARDSMVKYESLLEKVSGLHDEITTLKGQVAVMEYELKHLKDAYGKAEAELLTLRAENTLLQAALTESEHQKDEFHRAHEASLTLFEAAVRGRSDQALLGLAVDQMAQVLLIDARLRNAGRDSARDAARDPKRDAARDNARDAAHDNGRNL